MNSWSVKSRLTEHFVAMDVNGHLPYNDKLLHMQHEQSLTTNKLKKITADTNINIRINAIKTLNMV